MTALDLDDLARCSRNELERLYATSEVGPVPAGRFRGTMLTFLDTPGARRLSTRFIDGILFEDLAFGIDFDVRRWWFVRPAVAIGRFELDVGPSRWREATTCRMRYGVSRLPGPIRGMLYDEVKPLSERLCLGLGGIDAEAGEGDHFFFALSAM